MADAAAGGIFPVPNAANPDAGSLPGELAVGADGAAHYSLPIAVPPGTAGMVPTLSLDYSSANSRDGLLGRGWSLGGLSAITRCPRTLAQDNYAGRVGLDASDRYCLDSQRLILVSGTPGATAEYRTEIDSFARISSSGSDPARGPEQWEVRTRDGRILQSWCT